MTQSHARKIGTDCAAQLQRAGFIAVFAGGCVRDRFLGLEPKDFDVATNATPEQIQAVFAGDTVIAVGAQFGVIVIVREGVQIEVATLRTDGQYADGRRPDSVTFVTSADPMVALKEDAARRDLTVNSMFEDPITGVVYDFFGGQADIKARLLRTVGNASERFGEDRLRMLRVVRFAGKLGFDVADELLVALKHHAGDLKPGLVVSWERVAKELEGMLTSKDPLRCMELLFDTGLMDHILPELLDTQDPRLARQDPIWHPEGLVWTHTKMVLLELIAQGASFELLLAGLLHDVAKPLTMKIELEPAETAVDSEGQTFMIERVTNIGHAEKGAEMARAICNRLKLSGKQTFQVVEIVRLHMQMHSFGDPAIKRSKLVRLLEHEHIMDLIMMQHADALGTGRTEAERASASLKGFYLAKLEELRNQPTASLRAGATGLVDGLMIKDLGFKPGPVYRVIKEAAFEAQHDGVFTDEAGAREWLKKNEAVFRSQLGAALPVVEAVGGKHCC
jgi:poly(A) polymerase